MVLRKRVRATNSVVFIHDAVGPICIPDNLGDALVRSTSTCITVGTVAEMDGETLLVLSTQSEQPIGDCAFSGVLETPSWKIAVTDVGNETLLQMDVFAPKVVIEIWVNDQSEPDKILMLVSN